MGVAPLEGLWWSRDYEAFTLGAKDSWCWTVLINQPEEITAELIGAGKDSAPSKKKLPAIGHVRRETLQEGLCAQALHAASYDAIAPLLAELHGRYLDEHGLARARLHHEI